MSGVLVDTSIWINHLRKSDPKLVELLGSGLVRRHPMVEGELSLGNFKNKTSFLVEYVQLKEVPSATHQEVRVFTEKNALSGAGIGWIDAHLLASCALGNAKLYSADSSLLKAAEKIGIKELQ
ncbi:twitching motility protein PilT [Leptospira wolffii]|uniref:Twitching motility protein PilT n=1 Tax=Leptospira wolffii TaxID=409998 RepID=A0A2M9ZG70_9LEPT|nr:twitching motility protein PilT [Leptospira wolffii]PJZ67428.1 twitching motility protein PilT [Leptospira wolffii]TGK62431.1 twitching motility protein PilT [Leptospira wolffii]TGK65974.1 twitching motility protein PilT [Leptospira wolffii]TGK74185.1 twitching motility protein PilT [Leptospira wolffii]TGL29044.1 twitching motility protein PilT [Leptospira wolffii]